MQKSAFALGPNQSGLIIKGGLKIEGCKIEGLLYMFTKGKTPANYIQFDTETIDFLHTES